MGSMGATTILPPPNKLPLPRNYTPSCSTGLVNIYNTPVVASQPWRLPKEKRRRRREAKKITKTPIVDSTALEDSRKAENEPEAPASKANIIETNDIDSSVCLSTQQTAHPSINSLTVLDSDFVRVSASESVPQTILASQDNGEIEQEIVDLNAVANSVSAELTVEANSVSAADVASENIIVQTW